MQTTDQAAGTDSGASQAEATEQKGYLMGVIRHAARLLAAVILVPLLVWRAAAAYSKGHPEGADAASSAAIGTSFKVTLAGAGIAGVGGLTATELAALGGLMLGACGFAVNAWLGWRKDRREQREHEARMAEPSKERK